MVTLTRVRSRFSPFEAALCALFAVGFAACTGDDGDTGPAGPPGGSGTDSSLEQGEDEPGIALALNSIRGGTASGGRFRAGDRPIVNFSLAKDDGSPWDITELSSGRTLVSGPTFNYQRVIAEKSDVLTLAVEQNDGSFDYTFADPIPATYLAPLNDSASFGPEDGELTGQPLLEGTYTLGLYVSWDYTVDGESQRDADNATIDFVIGNSGVVEPREVVAMDNCNRCHTELRIHGSRRKDVALCVLCHNAGAEDKNDPLVAGGTLGVSIDFKVMIHKLHSGEHLPSVLGVAANPDGSRNYLATPAPYLVAGNSAHDYSAIAFPAWPQALVATPRDQGYSALSADAKAAEDLIRTGPSNCAVCHGDPDGDAGPLVAPAQGDLHRTEPSRLACGSCHDDVHWGQPYTANGQTMPEQANDSNCKLCHAPTGNGLAVFDAHLHPLSDPTFDAGVVLDVESLVEAGTDDDDGTVDPGEKIEVTFRVHDDAGADLSPAVFASPSVVISGPTDNYNVLLSTSIPAAALTGAQPFTVKVPMLVTLDRLGVSTGALDTLGGTYAPHWNVTGATTSVLVRTATGGGDTFLAAPSAAPQNYVDVADITGFARDEYIVVDDGTGSEEYARIQFVEGARLWFSALNSTSYRGGLALEHQAGATVREVTLATKASGDYTVDAAAGEITELVEFGAGNVVLATYTTDFVMPATYPLPLNASPDLDETSGEWTGKPLVDGTYTLGIWSSRSLTLTAFGESNSYRSTSDARNVDFLVGSASEVEPYELISSGTNCFNCHQELAFHGFGRRGFESCVLCHGAAGSEDRPQYVAANAPDTTGVTVNFRTMLHKIHMGEELAHASSYEIVGFGSGTYPNNFGTTSFGEVVFPALPGGVQNCAKCHGAENEAWHAPSDRSHPTDQGEPVRRWAAVCGACHDSTDAQAHISVQTDALGNESCGVCHGESSEWSVERMHKAY